MLRTARSVKLTFLNTYKNFLGGSKHTLKWLCKSFGFNINQKIVISDIYMRVSMTKFLVDFNFGEFEKIKEANINKLIECALYRGRRHLKKLPVNGQRTHTNARTRKKRFII